MRPEMATKWPDDPEVEPNGAAQGFGSEIIEKIAGSYTNVVGLPMEKTIAALRVFGIEPL